MQSRSFRASLATFAAVFTLSLSGGNALAQPSAPQIAFYPAQNWTVAQSDQGSCVIDNEYNNGYRVAFDNNASGTTMLRIDFQQNIFESGKSYEASLRIPGSAARSVPTVATQASLLQFDVAAIDGFYKRLATAGVMDVLVEGNNFRFFMTGFGAKANDLASCVKPAMVVANRAPSAVIPQIVTAPAAAPPANLPNPDALLRAEPISLAPTRVRAKPAVAQSIVADLSNFVETPAVEAEPIAPIARANPVTPPPSSNLLANIERTLPSTPAPLVPMVVADVAPAPQTISMSSPKMKVTRQSAKGEIDVRGAGIKTPKHPDTQALKKKIRVLEAKNDSLRKDQEAADKIEISSNYSISADNWDLERATMRFQEAERQLKVMGQKLQRERAKFQMEQKELESMLFDPELTSQKQLAELANLEDELARAQEEAIGQRVRYEERIKILEKQIADF